MKRKYPPYLIIPAAVLLVAFIGFLDYATGPEVSFSIFYVYPIFLVSWNVGRKWGTCLALLSGVVWLAADLTTERSYSHVLIPYWNALVRTVFFLFVGVSVPYFRRELQKSIRMVQKLSAFLPMCAWCKQIRDERGEWHRLEEYLQSHSGTEITHGICPDCIQRHHTSKDRNGWPENERGDTSQAVVAETKGLSASDSHPVIALR